MKLAISKCTTSFLGDTAPITLHTDASDYGVGGYSFQTVDGIDQPVASVSRSLDRSKRHWSVIQNEAYGIFYPCMYLQSLLRDRFFTIGSDHRNLLFITEASNPMIVRRYMALSESSFTLEFIPGVDNDIADSLSRLCRNNMIDSPKEYSPEYILSALHIESYKSSCCTTQLLTILDMNVHSNVSRIQKIHGNINDNIFDTTLIIVHVVRKCTC